MNELDREELEKEASMVKAELQNIEIEIQKTKDHYSDIKYSRIANKVGIAFLVFILLLLLYYLIPVILNTVKANKFEAHLKEVKYQDSINNSILSKRYWDSIENSKIVQAKQDAIEKPVQEHCYNDKLSRLFDYEINSYSSRQNDNSVIILNIVEKKTKNVIQSMDINTNFSKMGKSWCEHRNCRN